MAFEIPNQEDSVEDPSGKFPQAEPDNVDFDILAQGLNGEGVVSGCAVTEDAPQSTSREASGAITLTESDGMYLWVACSAVGGTAPKKVTVQIDCEEAVY